LRPCAIWGETLHGTFQAVNRVLPWYRMPTILAVLNLGALRDVLRAKNLHDTSDIPVTRPEGLRQPPQSEFQRQKWVGSRSRPDYPTRRSGFSVAFARSDGQAPGVDVPVRPALASVAEDQTTTAGPR